MILLRICLVILLILEAKVFVSAQRKLVCYYRTKSFYHKGGGKFQTKDIDPFLCTHLVVAFAGLEPNTYKIQVVDPWTEGQDDFLPGAYLEINQELRSKNPALKTLLSIGGWPEGSETYSKMAADPERRRSFLDSVIDLFEKHTFNGLDFHWEFPAQRGGSKEDKSNFVILLKELREEFDKHGWLLTAAVSAEKDIVESAYDIPGMARSLDFISVMAYDFHGPWDGHTGHQTPMNARPRESERDHLLTVNYSIHYWLNHGVSRDKLILGVALYGRSFTLASDKDTDSGALAVSPGVKGPYTSEPGYLGYNEICETRKRWKVVQDPYYQAPYGYYSKQWVSYDDEDSIERKCEFANSLGLGGVMVWSIDTDDFKGRCYGVKFPLTNTVKRILKQDISTETETPVVIFQSTSATPVVVVTETPQPPLLVDTETPQPPLVIVTETPQPPPVVDTETPQPPLVVVTETTRPPLVVVTETPQPPLVVDTETPQPPLVVVTETTQPPLVVVTETPQPPLVVTSTTTKRPSGNRLCPSAGMHRDLNDCSRFYSCELYNGQLFISGRFQCPQKGLLFDEKQKICNWAKDVDCNVPLTI